MSVASVVPSPVSVVPADISLDDPRLTSELQHENPDGDAYDRKKKVQHGLCYDSEGKLRVKPEIEQSLSRTSTNRQRTPRSWRRSQG